MNTIRNVVCLVVVAVLSFALVGNVVGASPISTVMAIYHAATGSAESLVMQGNGLTLLAARLGNNWITACLSGTCASVEQWFEQTNGGSQMSPMTFTALRSGLEANGWKIVNPMNIPGPMYWNIISRSMLQVVASIFGMGLTRRGLKRLDAVH